jgi:ABC-type transporter Mla subunit MlaD
LIASLTNLLQTLSGVIVDDRPELEETLQNLIELTGLLAQDDDLQPQSASPRGQPSANIDSSRPGGAPIAAA